MNETCPKCGNGDFAIARDMTADRFCGKCWHSWPHPDAAKDAAIKVAVKQIKPKLTAVDGNTGTLGEYYGLLDRVEMDLIQGQKLCTTYAPEVTDCATDLQEALTKLKTAIVEAAIMEGEIKWP